MIVLNEHEWAEDMISSRSLGKKPFETLSRVARYYIDSGFPKNNVRGMMDSFLLQCEPTSSLPKWSETLDFALNWALKHEPINITGIDITKSEMNIIDGLNGSQLKRLAFTLLCLAKYWDIVNKRGDHWVNSKDSDIMRMANINTSIKRQSLMYCSLNELGLIQYSKKIDNTNVRICFIHEGCTEITVTDFRNLGYQYLMNRGSRDYICCQNCGLVVRKNKVIPEEYPQRGGRPQKYCKECAVSVSTRQHVEKVMRR